MKRFFAIIMALALLLGVCAAAESEIAEDWLLQDDAEEDEMVLLDGDELAGGWAISSLETARGSDTLKEIFNRAVEDLPGVEYTPVILLGTQVVSGMNYCILAHCNYTETDTTDMGWALVYLYEAFGGDVQVTNVVDVDISALSDYGLLN